jgi:hypothetical protein
VRLSAHPLPIPDPVLAHLVEIPITDAEIGHDALTVLAAFARLGVVRREGHG